MENHYSIEKHTQMLLNLMKAHEVTEAYYRKLPVLAITSSQHLGRVDSICRR